MLRKKRYRYFKLQQNIHFKSMDSSWFGGKYTQVWLGTAIHLVFYVLLGTAFIGRLNRRVLPRKRKAVTGHLPPVAIMTIHEIGYNINASQHTHTNPDRMSKDARKISIVRWAK